MFTKTCAYCSKTFQSKRTDKKTCGGNCRAQLHYAKKFSVPDAPKGSLCIAIAKGVTITVTRDGLDSGDASYKEILTWLAHKYPNCAEYIKKHNPKMSKKQRRNVLKTLTNE